MSDADLKAFLQRAFLPYAKGFAASPDQVDLALTLSPTQVHGTVQYDTADYDAITDGSLAEVDIQRAFRTLASWNDGRRPSLTLEKRN